MLSKLVLEKTFESSLDCREIKLVNPKGNQPWRFIGRTGTEAEVPILWPRDAKTQLIGKDRDVGKDWRWEEKRMTGWTGWMPSPTQWTRVWANSGRQWKTAKSGLLQFMGSQRVRINWATEQQQQCIVTRIQIKHVDKTLRGMGEHRKKQPLWAGGSRKISQRTGELVGTPRGEEGLSGCHELCRAENQATCQSVSIQGSFWRRNTF